MSTIRASFTYANVVASLALFVALSGGVVYAADKLGSKDIDKNAIKSKHVKADSLTGADVEEGRLEKVPLAAKADEAASAAQATRAGQATVAARANAAKEADHAAAADHATTADHAATAGEATSAEYATDADYASEAGSALEADSAGVSGYEQVYNGPKTMSAGDVRVYGADCPADKVVTSGGHWMDVSDVRVMWAYATDRNTYSVAFWNSSSGGRQVGVHAVCVDG